MRAKVEQALSGINQVLLGKTEQVRLAVACLLAGGHLLLEDIPGMGKTTLSHTLAQVMGLKFQRIQFTADLLPGDILGVSVFDRNIGAFSFHAGTIFTELLLADEINRATPRTQSALLEAMEEGQVSVEGMTRPLPDPFFVIATQNPLTQSGTFALPESQLDRFLMCLSLGYPDPQAEHALLMGGTRRSFLEALEPVFEQETLRLAQAEVAAVKVTAPLVDYVLRLLQTTRTETSIEVGLSPRAGLALLSAAKAWAYMSERDYVIPEDVQQVFPHVARHRLGGALDTGSQVQSRMRDILHSVAVL